MKLIYGMKGNSTLRRWSAARQRRVQEEFAELLRCLAMHSQEIGRLQLKGSQKAIDSVEREILQEEQRQPATADVS